MQRMQAEEKHEQAVNEVMEEIEDQLDSDEDDKGFLITTNASSGGSHPTVTGDLLDTGKQTSELEQFGNLEQQQDYNSPEKEQYNNQ